MVNNGPATATGVVLTQEPFTGALLTQRDAQPGQRDQSSAAGATVNLGTLAAGATATITFTVTPTDLGDLDIDLGGHNCEANATPGNKTTTATLSVGLPADVTTVSDPDPAVVVGTGKGDGVDTWPAILTPDGKFRTVPERRPESRPRHDRHGDRPLRPQYQHRGNHSGEYQQPGDRHGQQ